MNVFDWRDVLSGAWLALKIVALFMLANNAVQAPVYQGF